jgi:predicted metalloendopeptidase
MDNEPKALIVSPAYIQIISHTLQTRPPAEWISLLRVRILNHYGSSLDQRFQLARLSLDREQAAGYKLQPRVTQCIESTTAALPSLTDMMFVSKFYSSADNVVGSEVLNRVRAAFISILETADWLDNATRRIALAKARKTLMLVGAPQTYTVLRFPITTSFFNNSGWASMAHVVEKFKRLDEPVDRTHWTFPAATANAWYDNAVNAAFIPAGILEKPFFQASYSAARNFGAIGTVVGHELTHGFDNVGARYDESSALEFWWTETTASTFDHKAECIADLYDSFRIDGMPVDGFHTLPENIADMGGVKVALKAYEQWSVQTLREELAAQSKRLFFLTYGQLWCEKQRPGNSRFMVLRDKHAPKKFRVNGVLSQNAEFAAAFACPASTPLNPPKKCSLW